MLAGGAAKAHSGGLIGGAKGHSDPKAFLMVKICSVIGSISCDGVRAVLEWGLQQGMKHSRCILLRLSQDQVPGPVVSVVQ